ncbi:MAG: flagellar basal body-associated FliL family protein [Proteobacteria bacterium]|nr:flagellar basal body-associated FliL family protein [Pseudomonadota bacterium]
MVLIIIIGLVLVLILGGGAAFLLLKKSKAAGEDGETEVKHHDVKPVFVKLESFTVKLQPDEGKQEQQFMQTVPELKVRDALIAEKAKTYMPEIRHNILLLLSSRRPSELATPQGMEKLSMDIRSVTNKILDEGTKKPAEKGKESSETGKVDPDDAVQAVLFSTFIVQ